MKKKTIKTILVFAGFALYIFPASAQSLYINNTNETQDIYALSSISKLSFSDNSLTIHKTDNSTITHAISEIRYMSFSNYTGICLPSEQEDMLTVYPNPVSNLLNINLPSDKLGGDLLVLSLDGKILMNHKLVDSQTAIDLNTLPQGIYLCRYIYGTHSEAVKIIKQN
ncbi:MAG TPA: T9SS type A sorting domain-containing protein [Bacteroidales bacterium]|nr:T9SS type A sorting domain-containing protein [Bacteroidales bacterium]HOR60839.1 T9SS type A sorting domain-containing protein [Bacteroidales bacterium]HPL05612.1 T9SS type A sorting domain-containing protein [Bacteroidales bacterium]